MCACVREYMRFRCRIACILFMCVRACTCARTYADAARLEQAEMVHIRRPKERSDLFDQQVSACVRAYVRVAGE